MNNRIAFLILLMVSALARSEDQAIAELFSQRKIEGTIVISSLHGDIIVIHNDLRAVRRFSTASTFKILNTLISLEEKAISSKGEVLKWDGQIYEFPDWNRDQTLESAFKFSCVWCFQNMARRVGAEKYNSYLRSAAYGDLREPFEETTFWLDGSLQVSAIEQVELLKKIYLRSLPFSEASYETLRYVMLVEQTPAFTIRAKTGWAARMTPQVGWYVGYVETKDDVWFFATNLDIRSEKDLPLRQTLTREVLQAKEIIN